MNKEEIKKAILTNVDILVEVLEKILTPKPKSKFSVGSKVVFNAYKDGVDFNEYTKIWTVVSLEEAPQRIKCKQEGDFGGWHYSWPSEDELEFHLSLGN